MKYIKYLLVGMLFGIVLVKSEVVSWFRIQEMFRFDSFHMYGVIGSAVVVGVISLLIINRLKLKSFEGELIVTKAKPFNKVGNITGGILFGLGWALTGACPGPLYALAGAGYTVIIAVLLSAILGAFVYGLVREKLPH